MTPRPRSLRWRRRSRLALGLGTALLAAGLAHVLRGPTYLGRGVAFWFVDAPEGHLTKPGEPTRAELLDQATAEIIPVVIAAVRQADRPGFDRLVEFRQQVPSWARFLIPEALGTEVNVVAAQATAARLGQKADLFPAVAQAFPEFPTQAQLAILRALRTAPPRAAPGLDAFLEEQSKGTNVLLAFEAGLALLQLESPSQERIDEAIRRMMPLVKAVAPSKETIAPGTTELRLTKIDAPVEWARALIDLGPRAGAAIPALEARFAAPESRDQILAAVTLMYLDPPRYRFATIWDRHLEHAGFEAKRAALRLLENIGRPPDPEASGELVTRLTAILRSPGAARAKTGGVAPPGLREELDALRWPALGLLAQVGTDAAPAVPAITAMLGERALDQALKLAAVETLGHLGPIAPKSLPSLLPHLHDPELAPRVILLLAAYGSAAEGALNDLRNLAEGIERDDPDGAWNAYLRHRIALPAHALRAGLTRHWPLPDSARSLTNLVWPTRTTRRSADPTTSIYFPDASGAAPEVEPVPISMLARAAVVAIDKRSEPAP